MHVPQLVRFRHTARTASAVEACHEGDSAGICAYGLESGGGVGDLVDAGLIAACSVDCALLCSVLSTVLWRRRVSIFVLHVRQGG